MVIDQGYISDIIKCRISTVGLRSDGILHINISPNQLFLSDDYQELMDAAFKIGGGKRFLNLINVGSDTVPDHEKRARSTSKEGSIYKIADAFVISSLPQKLVGNFYMNFHKPFIPTRFFTANSEALEWLKKQETI